MNLPHLYIQTDYRQLYPDALDRYKEKPDLGKSKFRAKNQWINGGQNRTTVTDFYTAGQEISHREGFVLNADEPPILAGKDQAANPVEHLLNSLTT